MSKLNIIADLWASYERDVIPVNAPHIQIQETRRAFYAGARGLFRAIIDVLDDDREPTEQDLRVMDAIHRELENFCTSVLAGKN